MTHYVANGGLGGGSGIFFLMAFFGQKMMDLGSLYDSTSCSQLVHLCTWPQESGTVLFLSTNQKPAFGHHEASMRGNHQKRRNARIKKLI